MTTAELERIARDIVPPVGADAVCLVVDEEQRFRAAFVVYGRLKVAVGPAFKRPQEAARFAALLSDPPHSEALSAPQPNSGLRGAAHPASRVSRARGAEPSLGHFAEG